MELLELGPVAVLEFRSYTDDFREWTDRTTGKSRSMAVQTWRCETIKGQQAQVSFIANSVKELPPVGYQKGAKILVICSKITEEKDVLQIKAASHRQLV